MQNDPDEVVRLAAQVADEIPSGAQDPIIEFLLQSVRSNGLAERYHADIFDLH